MLRKLYDKVIALSESKQALPTLALVSFAESSFFPVPPDVVLVPMALAKPEKARLYALVCTVASVLGGILGYAIGAFLYDTVGHWLISAYGYGEGVEAFRAAYAKWGSWIILIKGLTPIPYKIVTIASGFAGTCLIAYMSSLTTAGFTATQYALFSSLYSLPGKLIASQSGRIVQDAAFSAQAGGYAAPLKTLISEPSASLAAAAAKLGVSAPALGAGYIGFFLYSFAIGLVAIVLAWMVRRHG